jgi:hypothetical protein
MSNDPKFVDGVLKGNYLVDEMDDFIDAWHDSDSNEELHDYLGFNLNEWEAIVIDNSAIYAILLCREHKNEFDSSAYFENNNSEFKIAARANQDLSPELIKSWLKSKGYIK